MAHIEIKANDHINLKVLDISHHNTIDPDGFKKMYDYGIRGIIHKSTQGTEYVDPMYLKRRDAAIDAGMLWGAYHFATDDNIDDQIAHFFDTVEPDDKTVMALDHEPNNNNQLDLDGCKEFLKKGEAKLGRKLVLYSGNLLKEQLDGDSDDEISAHRLWLAEYGKLIPPPGFDSVWLWQFSGDGVNSHGIHVPGIHGLIDMNSYAGSDEQLTSEWS